LPSLLAAHGSCLSSSGTEALARPSEPTTHFRRALSLFQTLFATQPLPHAELTLSRFPRSAEVEAARIAAEAAARAANPALKPGDLAKLAMDLPPPPPRKIAHLPPPRFDNPWAGFARAAAAAAQPVAAAPPPPARLPPPPAPQVHAPAPQLLPADPARARLDEIRARLDRAAAFEAHADAALDLARRRLADAAQPRPAPRAHAAAPAAPQPAAPRRAPAPAAAAPPPPPAGRFLVNRAWQPPPLPPPAARAHRPVAPPAPAKPKDSPRKNVHFAAQPQDRDAGPAAAGPAYPRAAGGAGDGVRFAPYPGVGGGGAAAAHRAAGAAGPRVGELEELGEAAKRRRDKVRNDEREAKRRRLTGNG